MVSISFAVCYEWDLFGGLLIDFNIDINCFLVIFEHFFDRFQAKVDF